MIWRNQCNLVTASGDRLPIMDHIKAPVQLGELELMHTFVVVESLVSPVILGLDFIHENALVLDFCKTPSVRSPDRCMFINQVETFDTILDVLYQASQNKQARICSVATVEQTSVDVIDECTVPLFQKTTETEFPECPQSDLNVVVIKVLLAILK